jgi:hypothetical protein
MQIFSDMTFSGAPDALGGLLQELDRATRLGGWMRDSAAEADIAPLLSPAENVRAFRNSPTGAPPHAVLWLGISRDKWEVTNIVPLGSDAIPPAEYTKLLLSFRSGVLPLAQRAEVAVTEPVTDVGPEHFLTKSAARLLHAFSSTANKSTGAAHPRDRYRWNQFVIATHRDGCEVGASELQQLLIENEGWPEGKAVELSLLFEYEISLLSVYDENRQ